MGSAVVVRLREGRRRRTIRSFMWGTADVATARRVRSVGQRAIEEGEKATQAFEWGARFWSPRRRSSKSGDSEFLRSGTEGSA